MVSCCCGLLDVCAGCVLGGRAGWEYGVRTGRALSGRVGGRSTVGCVLCHVRCVCRVVCVVYGDDGDADDDDDDDSNDEV